MQSKFVVIDNQALFRVQVCLTEDLSSAVDDLRNLHGEALHDAVYKLFVKLGNPKH